MPENNEGLQLCMADIDRLFKSDARKAALMKRYMDYCYQLIEKPKKRQHQLDMADKLLQVLNDLEYAPALSIEISWGEK